MVLWRFQGRGDAEGASLRVRVLYMRLAGRLLPGWCTGPGELRMCAVLLLGRDVESYGGGRSRTVWTSGARVRTSARLGYGVSQGGDASRSGSRNTGVALPSLWAAFRFRWPVVLHGWSPYLWALGAWERGACTGALPCPRGSLPFLWGLRASLPVSWPQDCAAVCLPCADREEEALEWRCVYRTGGAHFRRVRGPGWAAGPLPGSEGGCVRRRGNRAGQLSRRARLRPQTPTKPTTHATSCAAVPIAHNATCSRG